MRTRKSSVYVADFETTVYEGQTCTEVWASACVEIGTEDVLIFHSIDEQFEYFVDLDTNVICYFHNLGFDGSFWIDYLLKHQGFKQAGKSSNPQTADFIWDSIKDMPNNSFMYLISSMGQWYNIIVKVHNKIIEFRDSLKMLPFSVKRIGDSFKTKHRKLEMEYKGFRYAGCNITDEEKEYIKNDVLVVKEALEIMFSEGHNKLTIGSCCLSEYKKGMGSLYNKYYPDMTTVEIDENIYKYNNADAYIRQSYHGGWCYLVKGKENKVFHGGTTADVNSLYPSMMSAESGNVYPIGEPTFWSGNYIPKEALEPFNYYFIRIRTRFKIKEGKLPFIQIKNNLMYQPREMLETSDVYNKHTGKHYPYYKNLDGDIVPAIVTLTMTCTDFRLMQEHYDLTDLTILDGCYFSGAIGIFDSYILKYKKIKMESTGALRELAKLFLNNLYGKMASSTDSSYKVAYLKPDNSVGFYTVVANEKKAGYIPVGSAITSYARNFTIRAAQKNYHGVDKPGFIYADTDSIHCDLTPDKIEGIRVDDRDFCCWKLESCWDEAIFVRPKTYIEHITQENQIDVSPYYSVKCAGMPTKSKELFVKSMTGNFDLENEEYSEVEKKFITTKRELTDFKIGLSVPGKLLPKRISGGVILKDTPYVMR